MDNRLGISFGWAAAALAVQFDQLGIGFDPTLCTRWQRDSDAISLLRMHGLITSSAADRACDKLIGQMLPDLEIPTPPETVSEVRDNG